MPTQSEQAAKKAAFDLAMSMSRIGSDQPGVTTDARDLVTLIGDEIGNALNPIVMLFDSINDPGREILQEELDDAREGIERLKRLQAATKGKRETLPSDLQQALQVVIDLNGVEMNETYEDFVLYKQLERRGLVTIGPGRGPGNKWHRIEMKP